MGVGLGEPDHVVAIQWVSIGGRCCVCGIWVYWQVWGLFLLVLLLSLVELFFLWAWDGGVVITVGGPAGWAGEVD